MASGSFGTVDIHPEELEQNQDTPTREGIFATEQDEIEAVSALGTWISSELDRSMAARGQLEQVWKANLRQYEGVSKLAQKNTPIENASNIEIPLGAIAGDAVFAQILNLIFNVDPLVTVREVSESGELTEEVKVLQRFIEVLARTKLNLRRASENVVLDDVKLGTGIYYTRWSEKRKKTQVEVVTERGPVVKGVPLEDFFVPGGAFDDIQQERWVAMRAHLTRNEMNVRARDFNWDIDGIQPVSVTDSVRSMRERLGRHSSDTAKNGSDSSGDIFQAFDVYCLFDIDGDGIDEDLLVTFDYGSKKVLKWRFNPYEIRPFEAIRYQQREYLFYGMGILEMTRPFQDGATNLYNHWVDNSLLANSRFWVGKHGAVPNNQLQIWPNRFLAVQNPATDIQAMPMADTFPSAPAALQTTIGLAEKRTGVNDLSSGGNPGVLGSRTPGITALSLLQKSNERFGPAFDSARLGLASTVRQALYRYGERIMAGDEEVMGDIRTMMGIDRGNLIIEMLGDPNFDAQLRLELTASSASVNKEADRQNWLLLVQQVVTMGEKIIGLAQLIESPEVGEVTKSVARQLVGVANEIMDRTLRTFDQVRDPGALLIDIDESIAAAEAQQPPAELDAIQQMLAQMQQAGGGQGGQSNPDVGAVPFG